MIKAPLAKILAQRVEMQELFDAFGLEGGKTDVPLLELEEGMVCEVLFQPVV